MLERGRDNRAGDKQRFVTNGLLLRRIFDMNANESSASTAKNRAKRLASSVFGDTAVNKAAQIRRIIGEKD
jgi:hypothetical protein